MSKWGDLKPTWGDFKGLPIHKWYFGTLWSKLKDKKWSDLSGRVHEES